jgi:hypothetical protein
MMEGDTEFGTDSGFWKNRGSLSWELIFILITLLSLRELADVPDVPDVPM